MEGVSQLPAVGTTVKLTPFRDPFPVSVQDANVGTTPAMLVDAMPSTAIVVAVR